MEKTHSMNEPRLRPGFPRFSLTPSEMIYLMVAGMACGRWGTADAPRKEGKSGLLQFLRVLHDHGYEVMRDIVQGMQHMLMARRGGSFLEIQEEPPFSPPALSNLVALDRAWMAGGDEAYAAEWERLFSPGWEKRAPAQPFVRLSGGPGDCEETAYIVHAPDRETRTCAQYWLLNYTYGRMDEAWVAEKQYLTAPDESGRSFDVMQVRLPGGELKMFYFDRDPMPALV